MRSSALVSRRSALAWLSGVGSAALTRAASAGAGGDFVARPPGTFAPLRLPGIVTKAEAKGAFSDFMQRNLLWPKPEVARRLLERALTDLALKPSLPSALGCFVHPDDRVAIKVNGISGQTGHTVATNFEVLLPLVEGLLELGVPPERVVVYEQYPSYLYGCRVNVGRYRLPDGVRAVTHNNQLATMEPMTVYRNIPTRYCSAFTDATAVIALDMMKDHSLCGFSGALKNVTHGTILNPHDHHAHLASPQIALLYKNPIVTSRVRLHITDAFKIIFDKGPLDKDPRTRAPHGAIYASTDPVALDRIGARVIDAEREQRGGVSLEKAGRPPRYIEQAANLGLGVFDENDLSLRSSVI